MESKKVTRECSWGVRPSAGQGLGEGLLNQLVNRTQSGSRSVGNTPLRASGHGGGLRGAAVARRRRLHEPRMFQILTIYVFVD